MVWHPHRQWRCAHGQQHGVTIAKAHDCLTSKQCSSSSSGGSGHLWQLVAGGTKPAICSRQGSSKRPALSLTVLGDLHVKLQERGAAGHSALEALERVFSEGRRDGGGGGGVPHVGAHAARVQGGGGVVNCGWSMTPATAACLICMAANTTGPSSTQPRFKTRALRRSSPWRRARQIEICAPAVAAQGHGLCPSIQQARKPLGRAPAQRSGGLHGQGWWGAGCCAGAAVRDLHARRRRRRRTAGAE